MEAKEESLINRSPVKSFSRPLREFGQLMRAARSESSLQVQRFLASIIVLLAVS